MPWLVGALVCQLAMLVTIAATWKRFRAPLAALLIATFVVASISRTFVIHFSASGGESVFCLQWVALDVGVWIHLAKLPDALPRR